MSFRSQFESAEERELRSLETAAAFDPTEDKARQEFKKDADANWLIKKYGANIPVAPVAYGEANFDVDALTARVQAQTLTDAFSALPEAIRAKYPTWDAIMQGIANGSLTTLEEKVETPAEVSSAEVSA